MSERYEVFIEYNSCNCSVEVYIFENRYGDVGGGRFLCTDLKENKWKEVPMYAKTPGPTFELPSIISKPFLQAMANTLDKYGIRPEGKPVLENELTAVKYHLEDMRKISFKHLGIEEKGERKKDDKPDDNSSF